MQALLTWRGVPCGWVEIPVAGNELATAGLVDAILAKQFQSICTRLAREHLLRGQLPSVDSLFQVEGESPLDASPSVPSVSVVLCTRNRPDDLRTCLQALSAMQPAPLEILVVDNAPSDESSLAVVSAMSGVRYVREPRPGLAWARNRGIVESSGDVIAFVDDDVKVDRLWTCHLQRAFIENPAAGVVTGLILPAELETEAQVQFEGHGGFGRGYGPKWFHPPAGAGRLHWSWAATGLLGSGANMAFRRSVFERIGLFAPELGAGTRTEGGEDLEILYRVFKHEIPAVYEPRAFVWHRHRSELDQFLKQMHGWGVGCIAFLQHSKRLFPDQAMSLLRFEIFWTSVLARRVLGEFVRPGRMPAELPIGELLGALKARPRYREARRIAAEIEDRFGPIEDPRFPHAPGSLERARAALLATPALRDVDLARRVERLGDMAGHETARISVTYDGKPISVLDVHHRGLDISRDRLINLVLEQRSVPELLAVPAGSSPADVESALREKLGASLFPERAPRVSVPAAGSARKVTASIVLVARRGNAALAGQRKLLAALASEGGHELFVIDAQGEPKIPEHAARDVIVCTTDEVVPAADWLERLLAPFVRNDIDVVCGRVLPAVNGTRSDSTGSEAPVDLGSDWFLSRRLEALPGQTLGATANLAVRRQLLQDPALDGFGRLLGQGAVPGGHAEYFFYRLLRCGYKLRYEPRAVTWYQHDEIRTPFMRRRFERNKSRIAYRLRVLLRGRDLRGLAALGGMSGSQYAFPEPPWR